MGGGLGGDRQPGGLGRPDQLDRAGGRQVLEVHGGAGEATEGQVAADHELLGLGRDAGDAEAGRPLPLVHVAAGRQAVDLAVLGQGDAQAAGVLHGPAHEQVVLHAAAVVGEDAHVALVGELGHRGQRLAAAPHGDGGRGLDVAQGPILGLLAHPVDDLERCRWPGRCWASPPGSRSRRAPRPGCPTRWSRRPPGRARAGGCAGRPGRGPRRSRPRRAPRRRPGTSRSASTARTHPPSTPTSATRSPVSSITRPPLITSSSTGEVLLRGVRGPTVRTRGSGANSSEPEPSSRNSTAMRTGTPLRTCSVMTALGRSATSAAISTPRFMGPGCMTMAPSGSRSARSAVRPNSAVYSRRLGTSASVMRSRCMRSR